MEHTCTLFLCFLAHGRKMRGTFSCTFGACQCTHNYRDENRWKHEFAWPLCQSWNPRQRQNRMCPYGTMLVFSSKRRAPKSVARPTDSDLQQILKLDNYLGLWKITEFESQNLILDKNLSCWGEPSQIIIGQLTHWVHRTYRIRRLWA